MTVGRRTAGPFAVAAIAVLVAVAGSSELAQAETQKPVHACVNKRTKVLKLRTGKTCPRGTRTIALTQGAGTVTTAPSSAPGETGPAGPPGSSPNIITGDKGMPHAAAASARLLSIAVPAGSVGGVTIDFTILATNGAGLVTSTGRILVSATSDSVSCDMIHEVHVGTVNPDCALGFYAPGSQPGVAIIDNLPFTPTSHHVWYTITNNGPSPIRLEP